MLPLEYNFDSKAKRLWEAKPNWKKLFVWSLFQAIRLWRVIKIKPRVIKIKIATVESPPPCHQATRTRKKSCRGGDREKKSCQLAEKVPPTRHHFSNGPSLKVWWTLPFFLYGGTPGYKLFFLPNSRFSTVSAPLSHVVKTWAYPDLRGKNLPEKLSQSFARWERDKPQMFSRRCIIVRD